MKTEFGKPAKNARSLLDAGVANDRRAHLATCVHDHHLELVLRRDVVTQEVLASQEVDFGVEHERRGPRARQRVAEFRAVPWPEQFVVQRVCRGVP